MYPGVGQLGHTARVRRLHVPGYTYAAVYTAELCLRQHMSGVMENEQTGAKLGVNFKTHYLLNVYITIYSHFTNL